MHDHFEGCLTARDSKRHIPHRIVVPNNARQMDIEFRFEPLRVHDIANMLTLTVFDPDGFRGAGHRGGCSHHVRLGPGEVTPGYLPGPLQSGEWIIQIDTHLIMPGADVRYAIDVNIVEDGSAASQETVLSKPHSPKNPRREEGWYRGDLHSHTHHSDAGQRTVTDLVRTAREHNLDFIFLTDHNTTSGLDEMFASATDDLVTAGGIELTTYWGHALCLGTRDWIDWCVRPGTGEMERIAKNTTDKDHVFIVAHPLATGDPLCTGCTWRFGEMMPGCAQLIEIWNGLWSDHVSNNEKALSLWYDWLNQGRRLVATAGTDTHRTEDYQAKSSFTIIYAEELSEAALLRGLRAGHVYLSSGPKILFEAHGENSDKWMIGETVTQPASFGLSWENCEANARIRLVSNGKTMKQWSCGVQGEYQWTMSPDESEWVLIEIRNAQDELCAITNPFYLDTVA